MSYRLDKRFTWLWVVWLTAFIAIEGVAVFNEKRGDTLSELVWRWFQIKPALGEKPRKWLRVVLLVFMTWLVVHFVSGGYV